MYSSEAHMPAAAIVLLTGDRGAGKTQLLQQFSKKISERDIACYGIITEQILVLEEVQGYRVRDVRTDETRVLATKSFRYTENDLVSGSYLFDLSSFEMANKAFDDPPPKGVALIDEIGPLELQQKTGLYPVLNKVITREISRAIIVVRPRLRSLLRHTLPFLPSAELTVRHTIEVPLVLDLLVEIFCDISR
jgi:nucleoside-triphosphatase THEP1